MKTTFTILLLFISAIGAFAQHDFSLKPMPKIDFNTGKPISDTTNVTFQPLKIQPDYKLYFSENKKPESNGYKHDYNSNMPIATPGSYAWNMPIAVPDSSVNYAIQIKRIGAHQIPNSKTK